MNRPDRLNARELGDAAGVIPRSGLTLALRVVGVGSGFLLAAWLARSAGADGTGIYYLALSISGLAVVIGQGGMETAVVATVSGAHNRGAWSEVHVARTAAVRRVLVGGVLGSLGLLMIAGLLGAFLGARVLRDVLLVCAVGVTPAALASVYARLLIATDRFLPGVIVENAASPVVTLIVFVMFASGHGALGAAASWLAGSVASFAFAATAYLRGEVEADVAEDVMRTRITTTAAPIMWSNVFAYAGENLDIILLGAIADPAIVGIYAVGTRIARPVYFLGDSVNLTVVPRFAQLHSHGDGVALQRLFWRTSAWMAVLMSVVVAAAWPLLGEVVRWLGPQFQGARLVMFILVVVAAVHVGTGPNGLALKMIGEQRPERAIAGVTLGGGLCLIAVLVPSLGALGAALARLISAVGNNAACLVILTRSLPTEDHSWTSR